MSELRQILSERGERRREQILALARGEALRRKRRRWKLRTGAAGAVGVAMVVFVVMFRSRPVAPPTTVQETAIVHTQHVEPEASTVVIAHIQTDPGIVERLALHISTPRWQSIGDDELLTALADAGRPAGLIHVEGRTILLPRKPIQ